MTGVVQSLIAAYKAAAAPPPASGKFCTSGQVSLACCDSTGVCASAAFGLGATCSPAAPEGTGWTSDC